jgi:hypothetical protein
MKSQENTMFGTCHNPWWSAATVEDKYIAAPSFHLQLPHPCWLEKVVAVST